MPSQTPDRGELPPVFRTGILVTIGVSLYAETILAVVRSACSWELYPYK